MRIPLGFRHRYQYLCSVAEASATTLQEMNPLVKVSVQQGSVAAQDLSFVQAYQVRSYQFFCFIPSQLDYTCAHRDCI